MGIPISSRAVWGKKPTRIPARISREEILHGLQQRVSARFMPGFQQRVSSKAQAKIPSSHVQQGALVFNCLPSLPKPNTAQHIEQSTKQSEKKSQDGSQSKASDKVAKQPQQSLCHIFNITNWHNNQSRNINRKQETTFRAKFQQGIQQGSGNNLASFQQGSCRVTSLLELSLLSFRRQNMTRIWGYASSVFCPFFTSFPL